MDSETTQPIKTPYERLGGEQAVRALAERFYDVMERDEPELTAVHRQDTPGKIARESRDRFALFLIGWLGGPQEYMARHGHPRLRMRHFEVPITIAMRDAWLRCMQKALDGAACEPDLRRFLDARFADVADFLRNRPE
ncbi:MAG: group II truncated hemoglobin [Myxococcota bacterium]